MKTGYFDINGTELKVDDIVINPIISDLWLVVKWTEKEKAQHNYECPYGFTLYGDSDLCELEIDEPEGFVKICSKGDPLYEKTYKEMLEIGKEMKEDLEE